MKIIFVCTGNTCRSPLAESYAKTVHDDKTFESRGIMVVSDVVSRESLRIIHDEQLATASLPEQLSSSDVEDSLLLTMTEQHKMYIKHMYKNANVMTLSEHVIGETRDVSDPYGGPGAAYDAVYTELKNYIDQL